MGAALGTAGQGRRGPGGWPCGSEDRERRGARRSQGSRQGSGREKVVGVQCSREGAGEGGGVLRPWAQIGGGSHEELIRNDSGWHLSRQL